MNDRDYLVVLSELKFIASVKPDEFLNTQTGYTEQKTILSTFIRFFKYPDENGKKTAEYCRAVIIKALNLLEMYDKKDESDVYKKQIVQYIMDAREGIRNLKKTHSNNNLAYALFDTIELKINSIVENKMYKN